MSRQLATRSFVIISAALIMVAANTGDALVRGVLLACILLVLAVFVARELPRAGTVRRGYADLLESAGLLRRK